MNKKLDKALKASYAHLIELGLNPIVGVSTLLELLAHNQLYKDDGEIDYFTNGDKLTPELINTFKNSQYFKSWKNDKGIFYFSSPNGVRVTCVPYYTRGRKTYANILDDQYFIWSSKHFNKTQTKTYKGTTFNIPYDPIGYLEEYYGKPWDDFHGRKDWHWHNAKNLTKMEKLPV